MEDQNEMIDKFPEEFAVLVLGVSSLSPGWQTIYIVLDSYPRFLYVNSENLVKDQVVVLKRHPTDGPGMYLVKE